MRITYLGTSHGVPTAVRNTSSILLEVGENAYIIDAGAPISSALLKNNIDLSAVKAMFITHYHMDHILGGIEFMALSNFFYKQNDFDVYLPEQCAADGIRALINSTCYHQFTGEDNVRLKVYDESLVYDDGVIKLISFPTLHMSCVNRPSYGFIIEAEGKRLMFTGDLAAYLEDFPEVLYDMHFDYINTECSHPSVENFALKFKNADCGIIAVTHIYPDEKIPQLLALSGSLKGELIIPDDNDVLVL